jgi:hypothetical protein
MGQIVKSSRFKSGEYGSQSAGVQTSTNNCWAVLVVWTSAKSAERHAVSKALGRAGVETFASENRFTAA